MKSSQPKRTRSVYVLSVETELNARGPEILQCEEQVLG